MGRSLYFQDGQGFLRLYRISSSSKRMLYKTEVIIKERKMIHNRVVWQNYFFCLFRYQFYKKDELHSYHYLGPRLANFRDMKSRCIQGDHY